MKNEHVAYIKPSQIVALAESYNNDMVSNDTDKIDTCVIVPTVYVEEQQLCITLIPERYYHPDASHGLGEGFSVALSLDELLSLTAAYELEENELS